MGLCRYILTPLSPWGSRLRSSTLYGLICWHVAEQEGDNKCQELIAAFAAGQPPFQVSSALPAGHLPMPMLAPISRKDFRQLAGHGSEEGLFLALQRYKKFRKLPGLPLALWQKHKGELSSRALFASYQETQADGTGSPHADSASPGGEHGRRGGIKRAFEPHVSIDRETGSARDGQLFFVPLDYFNHGQRFHLYADASDPAWLRHYLESIGDQGFGPDASTGKGRFAVDLDGDFQAENFAVPGANARLLLSVCASLRMGTLQGYYKQEVMRGKTGPGYGNPFKKPFLMLQEGATLRELPQGPFVLAGLNANPRVAQILQPLTLPCRLAEDA